MRHLRKYNESASSEQIERFQRKFRINITRELKEFCNNYLAYLLDDGFEINFTNRDNDMYIMLSKEDTSNFKWDDIKDHFMPFLEVLSDNYMLSNNSVNVKHVNLRKIKPYPEFDADGYNAFTIDNLDKSMVGINLTIRRITFDIKLIK